MGASNNIRLGDDLSIRFWKQTSTLGIFSRTVYTSRPQTTFPAGMDPFDAGLPRRAMRVARLIPKAQGTLCPKGTFLTGAAKPPIPA